jgi:hypothetical protein
MTFDFDCSRLHLGDATSRIALPWITPDAYFDVHPAGESNPKYYEAMLAMSAKRKIAVATENQAAVLEELAQDREDDRDLYPRAVLHGWGGIQDTARKDVPFSVDAALALIKGGGPGDGKRLPDWIFQKVRRHCENPANFFATPAADPPPPPDDMGKG